MLVEKRNTRSAVVSLTEAQAVDLAKFIQDSPDQHREGARLCSTEGCGVYALIKALEAIGYEVS